MREPAIFHRSVVVSRVQVRIYGQSTKSGRFRVGKSAVRIKMNCADFCRGVSSSVQEIPVVSVQRIRRQQLVRQAEGYLELEMFEHALAVLARCGEPESLPGQACFLRGEALRGLKRYHEAIGSLGRAAELLPERAVEIGLALGWCYKRVGRIDLAIEALERALEEEPDHALLHYNLACYWCLAGNKRQSLMFLSRALTLKQHLRELIADESDFDNLRGDPAFQALTAVIV